METPKLTSPINIEPLRNQNYVNNEQNDGNKNNEIDTLRKEAVT